MFEHDTPRDKQELYAAELTHQVQIILDKAFQSRPDLSVADIADKIGVTPERVREVLSISDKENLEGNMYVATLARYLRAMGYELKLSVKAAEPESDADKVNFLRPRSSRIRADQATYSLTLPGIVYDLLFGLENGSLPFNELLHAVHAAGFGTREAVEFLAAESQTGRITLHDDGSVSAVRSNQA